MMQYVPKIRQRVLKAIELTGRQDKNIKFKTRNLLLRCKKFTLFTKPLNKFLTNAFLMKILVNCSYTLFVSINYLSIKHKPDAGY